MAERNIDQFAAKLSDAATGRTHSSHSDQGSAFLYWTDTYVDVKIKFNVATELRDNTDQFCTGPLYPIFLKKLIPVFKKLLEGPPVFMSTSWEHVSSTLMALSANLADQALRGCGIVFWRSFIGYP